MRCLIKRHGVDGPTPAYSGAPLQRMLQQHLCKDPEPRSPVAIARRAVRLLYPRTVGRGSSADERQSRRQHGTSALMRANALRPLNRSKRFAIGSTWK